MKKTTTRKTRTVTPVPATTPAARGHKQKGRADALFTCYDGNTIIGELVYEAGVIKFVVPDGRSTHEVLDSSATTFFGHVAQVNSQFHQSIRDQAVREAKRMIHDRLVRALLD